MSITLHFIRQFFLMGAVCIFEPQIIAAGMEGAIPLLFVSQMIFGGLIWVALKQHTEQCRVATGLSIDESDTAAETVRYVLVILASMVVGSVCIVGRYPDSPPLGLTALMGAATVIGGFLGLCLRKLESTIQRETKNELGRRDAEARFEAAKADGQAVEA